MSNLTTIQAPKLNSSEYGNNLESQFRSINDNFMKLSNYNFTKGEDGKSIKIITYDVGKNGSSTHIAAIKEALKNRYNELHGTGGKSYDDMNSDFAEANIKTAESLFDMDLEDNQNLKIHLISDSEKIVGSLPFVYIDMRFHQENVVDVISAHPDLYENAIDLTCVMYFNENGKVNVIDNFPTLYYDKDATDESTLCWRFYGQNTGIPARGPRGPKGADTTLFVAKRAYVKNTENIYYLRYIITNNSTIKDDDFMTNEHLMHDFSGAPVIVLCDSVVSGDEGENDEESGNLWVTQLIDNGYIGTDEDGNAIIDDQIDANKRFQVLCDDGNKIKLSFDLTQLWDQSANIGADGEDNVGWRIPLNPTKNNPHHHHLLYTLRNLTKSTGGSQPYDRGDLILSYRPLPEGLNSGDLNFGPNPYDFLIYYPTIFRNPNEENENDGYVKYSDLTTITGGYVKTNCLGINIKPEDSYTDNALTVNGDTSITGNLKTTGSLDSAYTDSGRNISRLVLSKYGVDLDTIGRYTNEDGKSYTTRTRITGPLQVYARNSKDYGLLDYPVINSWVGSGRDDGAETFIDFDPYYFRIGANRESGDLGSVVINAKTMSYGDWAPTRTVNSKDKNGEIYDKFRLDPFKDLFLPGEEITITVNYRYDFVYTHNLYHPIDIEFKLVTELTPGEYCDISKTHKGTPIGTGISGQLGNAISIEDTFKGTLIIDKYLMSKNNLKTLNNISLNICTSFGGNDSYELFITSCEYNISNVVGSTNLEIQGTESLSSPTSKYVYIDLMGILTESENVKYAPARDILNNDLPNDKVNLEVFGESNVLELPNNNQYQTLKELWKTTDLLHNIKVRGQNNINLNNRVNIKGHINEDETHKDAVSLDVYNRIISNNPDNDYKVLIGNTSKRWTSGLIIDGTLDIPGYYNPNSKGEPYLVGGALNVGGNSNFNTNISSPDGRIIARNTTFYVTKNGSNVDDANRIWGPSEGFSFVGNADKKQEGLCYGQKTPEGTASNNYFGNNYISSTDGNYWKSQPYKVNIGQDGLVMYTGIPNKTRLTTPANSNYEYYADNYPKGSLILSGGPVVKTPDDKLSGKKQILLADGSLTTTIPFAIKQVGIDGKVTYIEFSWNNATNRFEGVWQAQPGVYYPLEREIIGYMRCPDTTRSTLRVNVYLRITKVETATNKYKYTATANVKFYRYHYGVNEPTGPDPRPIYSYEELMSHFKEAGSYLLQANTGQNMPNYLFGDNLISQIKPFNNTNNNQNIESSNKDKYTIYSKPNIDFGDDFTPNTSGSRLIIPLAYNNGANSYDDVDLSLEFVYGTVENTNNGWHAVIRYENKRKYGNNVIGTMDYYPNNQLDSNYDLNIFTKST